MQSSDGSLVLKIMDVNSFGDIPEKRLDEIRKATLCDATLQAEDKRDTPPCVPYFDVRDSLSVIDRVLVIGKAVVIPSALRVSIKRRLHIVHLCRDSMFPSS